MAGDSERAQDALNLAMVAERMIYLRCKEELDELKRATEDLTPVAEFDGETLKLLLPSESEDEDSLVPDKRVEITITAHAINMKLPSGVFARPLPGTMKPTGFSRSGDKFRIALVDPFSTIDTSETLDIFMMPHGGGPRIHGIIQHALHPPFGTIWTPVVRQRFYTVLDKAWETFSNCEISI